MGPSAGRHGGRPSLRSGLELLWPGLHVAAGLRGDVGSVLPNSCLFQSEGSGSGGEA